MAPGIAPGAETVEPPRSPDGSVKVSLFAEAPQIVTPIGAAVDAKGRLLAIESNTHFRPKNYQGPASDRILVFEDPSGAGKAGRITTFYEGGPYLMNLVAQRDGSVVVSSRNEIFRLVDQAGKSAGPEKTTLARLDTTADYPHNGLHGLAVSSDGHVYFSIGENLGGRWTLNGTDGKTLSDEKGSGAVFRVDSQGRDLTLVARGFWNPFGLGFDAAGNAWAVDNDPDGRPPSRLIHVLPGADYGFEFRYGRTGMHPLQAWDGELPGTLGMAAGVGEAPVAVVWQRGRLFVSSWRDHQVQMYKPVPRGAFLHRQRRNPRQRRRRLPPHRTGVRAGRIAVCQRLGIQQLLSERQGADLETDLRPARDARDGGQADRSDASGRASARVARHCRAYRGTG